MRMTRHGLEPCQADFLLVSVYRAPAAVRPAVTAVASPAISPVTSAQHGPTWWAALIPAVMPALSPASSPTMIGSVTINQGGHSLLSAGGLPVSFAVGVGSRLLPDESGGDGSCCTGMGCPATCALFCVRFRYRLRMLGITLIARTSCLRALNGWGGSPVVRGAARFSARG